MGNHDVSVDSYGENIEDRDTQQTVTEKRIELTQLQTPDPVSREKLGSCQGKIEATEEEIRHGEVDDKDGGGVTDLLAPDESEDGDDVAREAAYEEDQAADEGRHEHPVRVSLQ